MKHGGAVVKLLIALFICFVPQFAWAQFGGQTYLTLSLQTKNAPLPGKPFMLLVHLDITSGFHIQSHVPSESGFIPTVVTIKAPKGFKVAPPMYPKSEQAQLAGSTLSVYDEDTVVSALVTPEKKQTGKFTFHASVSYQACNTQTCFPPATASISSVISISAKTAPTKNTTIKNKPTAKNINTIKSVTPLKNNPRVIHKPTTVTVTPPVTRNAHGGSIGLQNKITASVPAGYQMGKLEQYLPPAQFVKFLQNGGANDHSQASDLNRLLKGGNLLLALPLIFLLGLALNLTPCVYPIIPITIGYFGSQTGKNGTKPLTLALFYVLGMALMYSSLGVIAGLTGSLFGSQMQNPWVLLVFALIMFGLALSQFDRPNGMPIWEFQLPASMRQTATTRSGVVGALMMGVLVGVVAAPCIGPAVVALLQWVGAQKSAELGFLVFFTLSIGLGSPYVLLATVSGSIKKLPRSGEWMMGVKHIFGFLMIWMGFYYLQGVIDRLSPGLGAKVLTGCTILTGLIILLLDRSGGDNRAFRWGRQIIGIGAIAAGVWMMFPAPPPAIHWQPYSKEAVNNAISMHKSILIDFSANWCAECKQLERTTFTDPRVGRIASNFEAYRADMTDFNGLASQELKREYGIVGLPTVVLLTPKQ